MKSIKFSILMISAFLSTINQAAPDIDISQYEPMTSKKWQLEDDVEAARGGTGGGRGGHATARQSSSHSSRASTNRSSARHGGQQHGGRQHSVQQRGGRQHGGRQYSGRQHGGRQYSGRQYSGRQYSGRRYGGRHYGRGYGGYWGGETYGYNWWRGRYSWWQPNFIWPVYVPAYYGFFDNVVSVIPTLGIDQTVVDQLLAEIANLRAELAAVGNAGEINQGLRQQIADLINQLVQYNPNLDVSGLFSAEVR